MLNRRGAVVAIVLGLFTLAAPRVGESDRTESRAIGVLRAIVSAESAYAAANGGRYGMLECLAGASCTSSARSASFLEPGLATLRERDGYRFAFHPVPEQRSADRRDRAALMRFAVVAVPVDARQGGDRSLCVDDRELISVTGAGTAPRVERGRCGDTNRLRP